MPRPLRAAAICLSDVAPAACPEGTRPANMSRCVAALCQSASHLSSASNRAFEKPDVGCMLTGGRYIRGRLPLLPRAQTPLAARDKSAPSYRATLPFSMKTPPGRVLQLQPLPAVSARISAAGALRNDPLQAQLASLGEDERSLGHQGVAEQNAVDAGDERPKCGSPFLDRPLTEILTVRPMPPRTI
jgi:hypothetical protein